MVSVRIEKILTFFYLKLFFTTRGLVTPPPPPSSPASSSKIYTIVASVGTDVVKHFKHIGVGVLVGNDAVKMPITA